MGMGGPSRVMRFRPCIDLHGGVVKQVLQHCRGSVTTRQGALPYKAARMPRQVRRGGSAAGVAGGAAVMGRFLWRVRSAG